MNIDLIDKNNIETFVKFYKKNFELLDLNSVQNDITKNLHSIANSLNNIADIQKLLLTPIGDYKFCLFHLVAKFGKLQDLQKVLNAIGNQNINVFDANHYTALHHCAISGATENARFLISKGADMSAKSSNETRNWLPIHYACKYGHKDIVEDFIRSGVDKYIATGFGLSPLHVACEFGKYDVANYLVNLGCEIDAETITENHNLTPLHYAVMENSIDIVKLLIDAGVDKYKLNGYGEDCVIMAIKRNHTEVASFFLSIGVVAMIEEAYEIAKAMNFFEAQQILAHFIKIKNNLFNKSTLIGIYPSLLEEMKMLNRDNLKNFYFDCFKPIKISPNFLINIRREVGFLNKTRVSLKQYCEHLGFNKIASELSRIEDLVKYQTFDKAY